jgi:hypothetical protein
VRSALMIPMFAGARTPSTSLSESDASSAGHDETGSKFSNRSAYDFLRFMVVRRDGTSRGIGWLIKGKSLKQTLNL